MKYHVKLTSVKPIGSLEDDFDFAEINVVKEVVFLIKKLDDHKILQYNVPLTEVAEITVAPYEDNEQKIPRCRL